MKLDEISREDTDSAFDWQMLDSQVSAVLEETRAALEEAQAATRKLGQKLERLYTLSGFMRQVEHTLLAFTGQVESGLVEVRHQLKEPSEARRPAPIPSTVPRTSTVEVGEPWPLEPEEAETEVVEEPALVAMTGQC